MDQRNCLLIHLYIRVCTYFVPTSGIFCSFSGILSLLAYKCKGTCVVCMPYVCSLRLSVCFMSACCVYPSVLCLCVASTLPVCFMSVCCVYPTRLFYVCVLRLPYPSVLCLCVASTLSVCFMSVRCVSTVGVCVYVNLYCVFGHVMYINPTPSERIFK